MKRFSVTFVSAVLLLSSLAPAAMAQGKMATFTVPAGEHALIDLARMSAQLQRRALRYDVAEAPKATDLTVHLQTELRLDATAYKEVVAATLFDHGLLVVAGERTDEVATVRSQHKAGAGTARTPEDILANPTRLEFVTTSIPSMADSVGFIHALRPHFPNEGPSLSVHDRGATIEIAGTSDRVAFALRLLQMFGGDAPRDAATPQWQDEERIAWPGGRMSLEQFVSRFATDLQANVIGDIEHKMLMLGKPAMMTRSEWFHEATRVLANHNVALVCRHVGTRLFSVRSMQQPNYREANYRANFVPSDEVADYEHSDAIMTTIDLQQLSSMDGFMVLRRFLAENPATVVGSLDKNTMVLCGPSHQVAHHLEALLQADSH